MGPQDKNRLNRAAAFVATWSELACTLPDDYACHMTCNEADAIAGLFESFGDTHTAEQIIEAHAAHDESGDSHYSG